ncbi:MAG: mechanosensitive ion channel [Ruminococcaceae bacterium]|nr:mechanosensitive ion channel [Oscillospiraceae bacterium]
MAEFFKNLWDKMYAYLTDPASYRRLGMIVLGLLVIFIGCKIVKKITKKLVNSRAMSRFSMTIRVFLGHVVAVALYVIVCLLGASLIGFNVSMFGSLIASIGLTVGLALQGSLSNIAGGVMVVGLKPFEVGDYIESNGVSGTVTDIAIFYTTLTTPDNKKIVVPNGSLSNSVVINYSANDTRRLDLTFSISYNTDLDLAKKVLLSCAKLDERILSDPAPVVYITEHAESAIAIQLRVWVRSENYWDVNFAMIEQVKRSFDQLGVEIPFPQLDVHMIK